MVSVGFDPVGSWFLVVTFAATVLLAAGLVAYAFDAHDVAHFAPGVAVICAALFPAAYARMARNHPRLWSLAYHGSDTGLDPSPVKDTPGAVQRHGTLAPEAGKQPLLGFGDTPVGTQHFEQTRR